MEKKIFELKDALLSDSGSGTIEGYGSRYGNVDSYRDLIERADGPACKNVPQFISSGCMTKGHDWGGLGIAYILDARDDETGLWFKAQYYDTTEAQDARKVAKERMAAGKFVGLSIGYETTDCSYETRDGVDLRIIRGYNVYEIAQVIMPANGLAGATSAKSFQDRSEEAFAAYSAVAEEWKRIRALRMKDSRAWPSDLNRSRIEAFAAKSKELLSEFEGLLTLPDEPKLATADEIAELDRIFCEHRLALAGVSIN